MSLLLSALADDTVPGRAEALAATKVTLTEAGVSYDELVHRLGTVNVEEMRDLEDQVEALLVADGLYRRYPDMWVRARLGEWPWSKQVEVMRAVAQHRKVAVHSSFGIGKSFTAARLICAWIDNHAPGEAFVISSAPTFAQVRAILWREVRRAYAKAAALGEPLPGRVNMTEWLIGSDLVGFGRKPAEHAEAAFQGLHARSVLVVLDEAGGIPESLFTDAEKLVTTADSRILAIGNPTHEGSYWWRVCTQDPDWHVIHVSAYDTPAYTHEKVPAAVGELVTSALWVEEQERKYTRNSPRFQQQVLGEFSKERAMTIVPLPWARAAMHEEGVRPGPGLGPTRLGVDVGAGGDWFVIRAMHGTRVGRAWRSISNDVTVNVALVVEALAETGATEVVIDAGGIGYGLPELIRQRAPHVQVVPVDFGERSVVVRVTAGPESTDPGQTMLRWEVPKGLPADRVRDVFANRRAELWWAARERSMLAADPSYRPVIPYVREPWDLTALEDPALIEAAFGPGESDGTLDELIAPGYQHVQRGQSEVIQVESKAELRKAKRVGGSTDHADALILSAFPHPTAPPEEPEVAAPQFGGLSAFGLGAPVVVNAAGGSAAPPAPDAVAVPDGAPAPETAPTPLVPATPTTGPFAPRAGVPLGRRGGGW